MSQEVSNALVMLNQIENMVKVLKKDLTTIAEREKTNTETPNFKFVGEDEFRNAGRNGNYE